MARTSIKLYASGFAQVDSDNPNTIVPAVTDGPNKLGSWGTDRESGVRLLFQIQSGLATLGYKRLYEAQARFATAQPNGGLIYPLKASYDPSTVTWNTQPQLFAQSDGVEYLSGGSHNNTKTDATFVQTVITTESLSTTAKAFLENCAAVMLASSGTYALWAYTTLVNATAPYIEIFYDDSVTVDSQIVYRSGPASGYANPRNAISFAWDYEKSGDYSCAADFVQSSATFYWKKSTDANYTAVSISGNTKSKTIAANTFPAGSTIQWYVSGTDTNGTASQTPVFSFSTAAGTATAAALAPISSVEDGSGPITFTWTLNSTDGQTPSGVDLWWKLPSEGQNEWHALLSNASPRTSYTAAAGTFPAGEIQWIVRAYNVDGTAGPWSTPGTGYYSFICVAAPDPVTGLNATAVPLTTVSWQSDGQQAYEISIDGTILQRGFGTDVYSWTADEPLADGSHEISVRVQGQYGFWSQPSTVTIAVSNSAPNSITLTGEFDLDALLRWTFGSTPGDPQVRIYRDGVWIGTASQQIFTDRRVLGTHEYSVLLPDSSGNYTRSNIVSGSMSSGRKQIAPLDGSSGWLELRLTENSADEDNFQWSRTQVVQHVTGAAYPWAELSQFEDLNASYTCAFRDRSEALVFEALRGKAVILKSRGDNVIIGILNQISKRQTVFYTAYAFTLTQIYARDFTEAD